MSGVKRISGILGVLAGLASLGQAEEILSLERCLELAMTRNHDLRALAGEAEAGAARAEAARRERYPELVATAAAESRLEPTRVGMITADGEPGLFTRDLWQAGAQLTVPLYTGGGLAARQRAEAFLARAADLDTDAFREQLAVQVAEVYHGLLAMEALLTSLDRSRVALESQEARTEALVREEKAAEVDLLRIRVRMASLEQQIIEVKNEADNLKETMNVLLARPPRSTWQPADDLHGMAEGKLSAATQPDTFTERADEAAARQRRLAAGTLTEAARSDYLPALQLQASYNIRGDWEGEDRFDDGLVGLAVHWNIWDFGRTRQAVREARARERALSERLASVRARRQFEWQQARDALDAAEKRLKVARLSVESAREALRIEQRKYDSGKGLISDVLGAEAAALEAESLLARARSDRLNALARCDFARGVLFTSEAWLPAFRQNISR